MADRAPLESVGRIKHQITRTDIAGTPDVSGAYFKLAQNYPLVQSADLTDTLVDDHTLDEPTNAVVSVATLNYNTGDQIFAKVDSGVLSKLLIYDRVMTNEEQASILLFLGIGETAIDSNGEPAVDSNGDLAVAPKSEYYTE